MITMIDPYQKLLEAGKLKCCMCKTTFTPAENYYTAQLPVKANWDYPCWGNFVTKIQGMALAYLCEKCGDDDSKRNYDIVLAVEIEGQEVKYHDLAWKGKMCVIQN
jgi:hypothetical protein